jgi:pyrimidine deaminase RibD-like protein/GNAT superfamily N-acetyltransferase
LLESGKALPGCRPNPPVGCVIVVEDRVVARGFTGPPGAAHAEAAAISALPPTESGVALSAFVTLEPCSFQGRTPSCAVALINRGIRSVFVGIVDPDPRNNGKGLQLLREAGLDVELGTLEQEIREFIAPYLYGSSQTEPVRFQEATTTDVPAMALCHTADPTAGADPRMAGYFDRKHHPQQALLPRVGYLALAGPDIIGYIAGHRTTRHGCAGEVQYLFVAPTYRRKGVATALLRLLAQWFVDQEAHRVCVGVASDSPPAAQPFYESVGAAPFKRFWYAWEDIAIALD